MGLTSLYILYSGIGLLFGVAVALWVFSGDIKLIKRG